MRMPSKVDQHLAVLSGQIVIVPGFLVCRAGATSTADTVLAVALFEIRPFLAFANFYPARACASKGLCDRSWCLLYIIYYILYIIIYISAKLFSYLSKYSLSDAHFNTGRLLFQFNRLLHTLAAPEVFVSSANPVSLPSGYRVSIVRNTNIDQIETTPLQYCKIRLNTPTWPGQQSTGLHLKRSMGDC